MKKIILGILMISLIALVGCQPNHPSGDSVPSCEICEDCQECINDKALVDIFTSDWGFNENDPEEIIYKFNIYNYGSIEAKSVNVKCVLIDNQENILGSVEKNLGNMASQSVTYQELYKIDSGVKDYEYYSAICFIKSCRDCTILNDLIPALKESLVGLR